MRVGAAAAPRPPNAGFADDDTTEEAVGAPKPPKPLNAGIAAPKLRNATSVDDDAAVEEAAAARKPPNAALVTAPVVSPEPLDADFIEYDTPEADLLGNKNADEAAAPDDAAGLLANQNADADDAATLDDPAGDTKGAGQTLASAS